MKKLVFISVLSVLLSAVMTSCNKESVKIVSDPLNQTIWQCTYGIPGSASEAVFLTNRLYFYGNGKAEMTASFEDTNAPEANTTSGHLGTYTYNIDSGYGTLTTHNDEGTEHRYVFFIVNNELVLTLAGEKESEALVYTKVSLR